MTDIIRKILCAGCVVAVSSVLLCSCGDSSAATNLSAAAAQESSGAAAAGVRETASASASATGSAAPLSDEDILPVSALNTLWHPSDAAMMEDGSMLVVDVHNSVIWRVEDDISTVYAGAHSADELETQHLGGYNDASYEDSLFRSPWAISPFLGGWAVSDTGNRVVRLLQDGAVQTVNAHEAEGDAAGAAGAAFERPTGLATDDEGNLYVADTFADTIYKITPDGELVTEATGISEPMGLCWKDGTLYVAETGKSRVISLKDGKTTVLAGSGKAGYADGPANVAAFASPQGVAVAHDGTIYVADTDNSAIREVRDGVVTTLYERDVRDLGAFFPITPTGLLDSDDSLLVCDPFARALMQLPLRTAQ